MNYPTLTDARQVEAHARGEAIIQATLARINAEFNRPRDPVVELVKLARRDWHTALRLERGLPVDDGQGNWAVSPPHAVRWAVHLRANAKRHMDAARKLRNEQRIMRRIAAQPGLHPAMRDALAARTLEAAE